MKKFVVHFLLVAIVLVAASFFVVGYEGRADYAPENRWTANRLPNEGSRYLLLSNPGPSDRYPIYERRHFGWPSWALYVDSSPQGTWYAKLDLFRFAANFTAACCPALIVATILGIRRWWRNRDKQLVVPAQPVHP